MNGELEASHAPVEIWNLPPGERRTLHIGIPNLPKQIGTLSAVDELHIFTYVMDEPEIRKYSDVSYVRGNGHFNHILYFHSFTDFQY